MSQEDAERDKVEADLRFDNAWAHYRECWRKLLLTKDETTEADVHRASDALDKARAERDSASQRLKAMRKEDNQTA